MSQDALIFPVVKRTVSIIAWVLSFCAILTIMFVFYAVVQGTEGFPVTETFIVFHYISAVCLALLAPWCIHVLLAGQGGPLLRFCGYAFACMVPLGILLSGTEAPLYNVASYYGGLLAGREYSSEGSALMESFKHMSTFLCTIAALLALMGWKRTGGYPRYSRWLLLAWAIVWFIAPCIEFIVIKTRPDDTLITQIFIVYIAGLAAYWLLTAWLSAMLASRAPHILTMPEFESHHFTGKREH